MPKDNVGARDRRTRADVALNCLLTRPRPAPWHIITQRGVGASVWCEPGGDPREGPHWPKAKSARNVVRRTH